MRAVRCLARGRNRLLRPIVLGTVLAGCTLIASTDDLQRGSALEPGSCLHNSDCQNENHICLFATCSEPCRISRDCSVGQTCLVAENGTACVNTESRACSESSACPMGTTCKDGSCKTACEGSGSLACIEGEECRAGACEPKLAVVGDGDGDSMMDGGPGDDGADTGVAGDPCQDYCDERTTCSVSEGVPSCTPCPTGFTDDHADGTQCTNIDECSSPTPPACDAHAKCLDTLGSAICQCNLGYNGDGYACSQNVPCPVGDECGTAATCEALETQKFCVCKSGYEGDGLDCSDIDECLRNIDNCDDVPNACVNGIGTFSCDCPDRYDGDGIGQSGCSDVKECMMSNGGCGSATAWSCQENEGAPPTCLDRDECALNLDDCDATAQCHDVDGSFTCSCGSDVSGNQRCNSNKVQTCSLKGAWLDTTTCSTSTCSDSGATAACVGICKPTQNACVNGDSYTCGSTGQYTVLVKDCIAPDEICRSGLCEANDPHPIGENVARTANPYTAIANNWYVIPIDISVKAVLYEMHVLVGAGSTGQARMAIWENLVGNPSDANDDFPGVIVDQTGNITLPATAGDASSGMLLSAKVLEAGRRYWIGAKFSGSPALYNNPLAGVNPYTYAQMFSSNPGSTMTPFPTTGVNQLNNLTFNFFLVVKDVAQ